MRAIIAIAMVLAATAANAAPVSLLCKGTGERMILLPAKFPDSASMVVDVAAKTLTLDNEVLPSEVLPIEGITGNIVTVHAQGYLISLNRLTGAVVMNYNDTIKGQLAWTFAGVCRPAQKLF